jgi:hypothetical protein
MLSLMHLSPHPAAMPQAMARKLRIFAGERHEFEGHPELTPLELEPRKLRSRGPLFELPPGFEPFNPEACEWVWLGCELADPPAQRACAAGSAIMVQMEVMVAKCCGS